MEEKMENNTLTLADETEATAGTVEAQLEQVLFNALGNKLSTAQKAGLHTAGTVTSLIVGSLLGAASDKMDTQGLLNGISKINSGLLQQEEGIKQIAEALKKRGA